MLADVLLSPRAFDHVGIVTNDTNATAERWAALFGISPPTNFNNAGPAANITYRGVSTDANIVGAYFTCDGEPSPRGLEILQPSDGYPSFWRDHFALYGTSPLYLGFASDSWNEATLRADERRFASLGCPTEQIGYWFSSSTTRGCYHYMDCRSTPFGSNVEVMSRNNCSATTQRSLWPATPMLVPAVRRPLGPTPAVLHCSSMRHVAIVAPNATATVAEYAQSFGLVHVPVLQRSSAHLYK
jgi:hypothetical protein